MSKIFNIHRSNIYTVIQNIEKTMAIALFSTDEMDFPTPSSISEMDTPPSIPRKRGRPKKMASKIPPQAEDYTNAIEIYTQDGHYKRLLKLYPPNVITLVIGRIQRLNDNALKFLDLTVTTFKHHQTLLRQAEEAAYQQGYADGQLESSTFASPPMPLSSDATLNTNASIIELQRQLIAAQRELVWSQREMVRLQKKLARFYRSPK